MKKIDDDQLLNLLIVDHEKGLKLIYERYFSLIYSFIAKECRSAEDTKDLTQEVFFKLWKIRHQLQITTSLQSYLFTIARNTFIDHVRKKINQRVFEELTDHTPIADSEFDVEDHEALNELLKYSNEMPDKRREVFRLKWLEGKTRKEIAEQMNISVVTVDIHIRKSVDFLKSRAKVNKLINILLLFI